MSSCLKSSVKNILKQHNLRPSHRLGQNFLIDSSVIKKIITSAELKTEDIIIEIGPGLGALTKEIAKRTKKVLAVEKDKNMTEILKKSLADFENISIVQQDILSFKKYGGKFKVIGNLPFYLTAPLIRKFLENTEKQPEQMALIVQKEVGQRICAKPPDMSILAVSVQFYAKTQIVSYISKKSFWPSPEVDAAVIKITPDNKFPSILGKKLHSRFFQVVRFGFSQPRKQLVNNLSNGFKIDKIKVRDWLQKNNIKPNQRAESLTIQNWIDLTKSF